MHSIRGAIQDLIRCWICHFLSTVVAAAGQKKNPEGKNCWLFFLLLFRRKGRREKKRTWHSLAFPFFPPMKLLTIFRTDLRRSLCTIHIKSREERFNNIFELHKLDKIRLFSRPPLIKCSLHTYMNTYVSWMYIWCSLTRSGVMHAGILGPGIIRGKVLCPHTYILTNKNKGGALSCA